MAKVTSYADDAAKAKGEWTKKKNGYYTADFNSGLCMRYVHFSINHDHIETGTCAKIRPALQDQEFTKMGVSNNDVSTIGVCENFMNSFGIGLDNKIIAPELVPTWFKPARQSKGMK
jgi:hypothetical protein